MSKRSNRGSFLPILMMAFGVILIVGAGIWSISVITGDSTEASGPVGAAEDNYPGIPRGNVADAKAAYDIGSAVFIDVREKNEYAISHIPGALSIPIAELPGRMNELDTSAWIIPY